MNNLIPVIIGVFLLAVIVPVSDVFATDSPLTFGTEYLLNDDVYRYWDDVVGDEDGVHWLWHQEFGGDPILECCSEWVNPLSLYYQYSADGEFNTTIKVRGLDSVEDKVYSGATLLVDGEIVYAFYEYFDKDAGSGSYNYIGMKKSIDNGATFGSEIIVELDGSASNDGIRLQVKLDPTTGDLYLFHSCGCSSDGITIGVIKSTDAGATWNVMPDVAGFEYLDLPKYYNPKFTRESIHIDDGVIQIVASVRVDNVVDQVVYNVSEDGGVTWNFGYDGVDASYLVPLDYANQSSFYQAPKLHVEGSQILVLWNDGSINKNRSSNLGVSWETTSSPTQIGISCDYGSNNKWDSAQLGSFIGLMCSNGNSTKYVTGGYDEPLQFISSSDLGDNWSEVDIVVADPITDNDLFFGIHGNADGNNMVFTSNLELDNGSGDTNTYIVYAQEPTGFSEFVVEQVSELDGVQVGSDVYLIWFWNQQPFIKLSMASIVGNTVFLTWSDGVANSVKWMSSALTNSGFLPDDLIAPVISGTEAEPITIFEDETFYPFDKVQCIDDVDGTIVPNGNFGTDGGVTIDTSNRGTQYQDYTCTDSASNNSLQTIEYIIKQISQGSSSPSTVTSGTNSDIPQLKDIPVLSFSDSPSQVTPTEGQSISDLFANLFDNRITEGITTPAPSVSSGSPAPTQTNNPVTDFLQNLFANWFN